MDLKANWYCCELTMICPKNSPSPPWEILLFNLSILFLQAAQEKEELQKEGDSLDAKINKAEKEIYALQNTLQVLNSCNNNFKQSFKKVTPSSM